MIQEQWKDIKGYEGFYQVSNLGNVKSLGNNFTRKEKILKNSTNTKGYLFVHLSKKNIEKTYAIHRTVAQAFLDFDIFDKKLSVYHKNGIKTDCKLENLSIGTFRYSHGERHPKTKLTEKQVLKIRSLKGKNTTQEIADRFKISYNCAYFILNNYTWKHI